MEPVNKRRRDGCGAAAEPEVGAGRGQDAALTRQHDWNLLKTEPRKYEWIVFNDIDFFLLTVHGCDIYNARRSANWHGCISFQLYYDDTGRLTPS